MSDIGSHEQSAKLDAVQLREAIRIADNISLSGAATALRDAQGTERADEARNAYIELRRALIDASRQDPDEWSERSFTADRVSRRATALFWVRAGTTLLLIAALFVITWSATGTGDKTTATAVAPYVSLISGLAGIGLGWMFGTVGRPVDTDSPKSKSGSNKRSEPGEKASGGVH